MSSQDILIACKRCNTKTPVRDMKYDMNGSDLICGRCYEIKIAAKKMPRDGSKYADPRKFKLEFTDPLEAKKEVKYFCQHCKFKFSRKKEHGVPKVCPNCNKMSLVIQGSTSADTLLRDSSRKEFDF
ncbi:hypothetical protein J4227_01585 [Candidatus Woesearchaeota archaeon]|nr:hypothetical protein [Candidatus Woesearchaeota archaeon]